MTKQELEEKISDIMENPDAFLEGFNGGEKFARHAERRVNLWLNAFRFSIQERLTCEEDDDKKMERYLKGLCERTRSKQIVSEEQEMTLLGVLAYEAKHFTGLPSVQRKTQLLRLIADYYTTCRKELETEVRKIADQLPLADVEAAFMNDEKAKHKAKDALYLCWYAVEENPSDDKRQQARNVLSNVIQRFAQSLPPEQCRLSDSSISDMFLIRLEENYPEEFKSLCTSIATGKVNLSFAKHLEGFNVEIDEAVDEAREEKKRNAASLLEERRETEEAKESTRRAKAFLQKLKKCKLPSQVSGKARDDAMEPDRFGAEKDWRNWCILGEENTRSSYSKLLKEGQDLLGPLKRNRPDLAKEVEDACEKLTNLKTPLFELFYKVRNEESQREAGEFLKLHNELSIQPEVLESVSINEDVGTVRCITDAQGILFSLDELCNRAGRINSALFIHSDFNFKALRNETYHNSHQFYEQWVKKRNALQEEIVSFLKAKEEAIQADERRERKSEREHLLEEGRKEYVNDVIAISGKYLLERYGTGMGIDLSNVGSGTSETNDGYVGMASMGMRMSMRLEQTMKQLLIPRQCDYIEIETGGPPEELQKRLIMVNFVTPHEIAHIVDHKLPSQIKSDSENSIAKRLEAIADEFPEESPLQISVQRMIKEAWIDGLGINMALSFGTADPFAESRKERLASVIDGFVAANDIATNAVLAKTQEPKSVDSIPDWVCVMLRFQGCARELSKLDTSKQRQKTLQTSLQLLQGTVKMLEERWNQVRKIQLSESSERDKLIQHFQEACREGMNIDIHNL